MIAWLYVIGGMSLVVFVVCCVGLLICETSVANSDGATKPYMEMRK